MVVTGATGGIGEAIVKNLAPDYAVVAQGRDSRKLAKLSGLGQQVYPVRLIYPIPLRLPRRSDGYQS